jgi:hypothetical protein
MEQARRSLRGCRPKQRSRSVRGSTSAIKELFDKILLFSGLVELTMAVKPQEFG